MQVLLDHDERKNVGHLDTLFNRDGWLVGTFRLNQRSSWSGVAEDLPRDRHRSPSPGSQTRWATSWATGSSAWSAPSSTRSASSTVARSRRRDHPQDRAAAEVTGAQSVAAGPADHLQPRRACRRGRLRRPAHPPQHLPGARRPVRQQTACNTCIHAIFKMSDFDTTPAVTFPSPLSR